MNRVGKIFSLQKKNNRPAFITYLVCGDPDITTTLKIMNLMVDSGVDIIELGVPFTDPIADGPVIQKGVERALKNNISLKSVLKVVESFRKENQKTPIILMGYMNPIERMGYSKVSKQAKAKGVDGVLLVDSPPEESEDINKILIRNNLCQIFLASPTTEDKRLMSIIKFSSGYLYYVSLKGITGSSITNFNPIKNNVNRIRKLSNNSIPVTVGFGIKNAIAAKNIGKFSDGIIIGSSIVELIEKHVNDKVIMYKKIKSFLDNISKSIGEK